jgi:hypothetical protein
MTRASRSAHPASVRFLGRKDGLPSHDTWCRPPIEANLSARTTVLARLHEQLKHLVQIPFGLGQAVMQTSLSVSRLNDDGGYAPIVARVSLRDFGSRNLKDQDLTPPCVTRRVRPLQRKSVISSRPRAGASTERTKTSVRGFRMPSSFFGVTRGAQNQPIGRERTHPRANGG